MIPTSITIHAVWSTSAVFVDNKPLDLEGSIKVFNHSNSFAWGYGGSGPAQFALALLLLYVPEDKALRYHQQLKDNLIARLPENSFIRDINILDHINRVAYQVDGIGQPDLFNLYNW